MPKRKSTKRRSKIGQKTSHTTANELEKETSNLETPSTNGYSTVIKEHGKTVELSCEVALPDSSQQQLLQNIEESSVAQEFADDVSIKQELLDAIIGNSRNNGELLDSANLTESNAIATIENCVSSIKSETENDADVMVIDDSVTFAAMDSKQKENEAYLGKLEKSEEKTSSAVAEPEITSMSVEEMHDSADQELDFKIINNGVKLDSQSSYRDNPLIDYEIKKELLDEEFNTSLVPSSGELNSIVRMDSRVDEIEYSTISDDSISNSGTSLLSSRVKQTNDSPVSRNLNLQQLSLSDSLVNNTQGCPISSDLQKVKVMDEIENSNQLPLIGNIQIDKTVLQTDQERNGILPAAVNASSDEQIHASNVEYPKNGTDTILESMQTSVCQDPGSINDELMSESSTSTIISSYPENSASLEPSLNAPFGENNDTCFKVSSKMKEEEAESHSAATPIVSNNVTCTNEIPEHEKNLTPAYFDEFASSWGLADEMESENFDLDVPFFSEMSVYFRAFGHKQKKTELSKTFAERAMKEHVSNKELNDSDDHLLKKLFPEEVPDPIEINEVNEIERRHAQIHDPPTSDPASTAEIKYDIRITGNGNTSEIAQMNSNDSNNCSDTQIAKIEQIDSQRVETADVSIGNSTIVPESTIVPDSAIVKDLPVQEIEQTLSTKALQDIINNVFNISNQNVPPHEPYSMSNQPAKETNSPSSEFVSSSTVFGDDDDAAKELPIIMELHRSEHNLHNSSDDPCADNSRFDSSDDTDTTTKNLPLEEALKPETKTQKNKIGNEDTGFVPRKKSRYEIIMERKEREKSLLLGSSSLKEKNMTSSNKTSQLPASSRHKDLEIFHPVPGNSTPLQKKRILDSKNDSTSKEKTKAKPVPKRAKTDIYEKKNDNKLLTNESTKDIEKPGPSGFKDMDAGMRFKNRNSSLFEDVTKVAQQPTPCRPRAARQKNSQSSATQLTMEEVHAQIDTDPIMISEPQKKKLSLEDYQSRNKAVPSSLNRTFSNTDTRAFSPNARPLSASHPIQDPRLARRLSGDSNLRSMQGYQPNTMAENTSPSNSFMTALPTSSYVPNSGHNPWNISVPMENQALSTIAPVSNLINVPLLHSSKNSPASTSSFLPSQTSDDMELCDFEPPAVPHSTSLNRFSSSHRTQHFRSTSSAVSSSYVHDPRLQPTSPHHDRSPHASGAVLPRKINLPCPRNEDDPYEVNLMPLKLLDSVSRSVMSDYEALMIVLSWVPKWLKEVDKPDQKKPPPLLGKSFVLKKTRLFYTDMCSHFTTIFPLMLFDLFFRMHDMMPKARADTKLKVYALDVVKAAWVGDMVEIEAKTLLSEKPLFTIEGQLAVMTYSLIGGKKRDVFAYVDNQYTDTSATTKAETLYLHIKIIHGLQNLDKSEKIHVFPFYSFSKFMSQVEALGYVGASPLGKVILNPCQPACTKMVLERFGGIAESVHVVNRAVEKIKDGISLNKPEEPRILIIDSPLGTDLMPTLIALAEDVKKLETPTLRHRILICTRTVKQLGNIGLRLLSIGEGEGACPAINITILLKAKGIPNPLLRKLTVEHKIFQYTKSGKKPDNPLQEPLSEDQELQEMKKDIFKESDVVLSLIPQNYDRRIQSLFGVKQDLQFSFCIIDEAHLFTEPESSLPLLYGIQKLILAGNLLDYPKVISKISDGCGYYRSLQSRLNDALTNGGNRS